MNASMRRDRAGFVLACVFILIFVIHASIILYLYQEYDFATFMLGALVSQQLMLIGFLQSWYIVDKNFKDSELEREDELVTACIAATTSASSAQLTQLAEADGIAPYAADEDPAQCVPGTTWNSTKWPTLVSLRALRPAS